MQTYPNQQSRSRTRNISGFLNISSRIGEACHGFSLLRCSVLVLVSNSLKNKPLFSHRGKASNHMNPVYIHSQYSLMAAIFPAGSLSFKKDQSRKLSAPLSGVLPPDRAVRGLLFQSMHSLRLSTKP